jgi:hypothetical protein
MQILNYGADLFFQDSQHRFAILESFLVEDVFLRENPIYFDYMVNDLRWEEVGPNEWLADGRSFK